MTHTCAFCSANHVPTVNLLARMMLAGRITLPEIRTKLKNSGVSDDDATRLGGRLLAEMASVKRTKVMGN